MLLSYLLAPLLVAVPLLAASVSAQSPPSRAPGMAAFVRVTAFRFTGNTILASSEAQALVSEGVGRDLTLAQIEALAARVTVWYRERGFLLARAYVPAQEIADGVVEIAVSEGRIGAVEVRGARRYDPAFLRAHVLLGRDRPAFQAEDFERSLFLLNDLPGLEVKSTLKQGATPGTTDVSLDVEKERLLTGEIEANNYGSRETGYERFGLGLNVNNPFGWNDTFGIRGLVSRDGDALWYARGTYSVALGYWGTRLSLAYTHINAAPTCGRSSGRSASPAAATSAAWPSSSRSGEAGPGACTSMPASTSRISRTRVKPPATRRPRAIASAC